MDWKIETSCHSRKISSFFLFSSRAHDLKRLIVMVFEITFTMSIQIDMTLARLDHSRAPFIIIIVSVSVSALFAIRKKFVELYLRSEHSGELLIILPLPHNSHHLDTNIPIQLYAEWKNECKIAFEVHLIPLSFLLRFVIECNYVKHS